MTKSIIVNGKTFTEVPAGHDGKPILDDEFVNCFGKDAKIETFDELTNPDCIIHMGDMESENQNRGTFIGRIWESIRQYIPEEHRCEAARALVHSLDCIPD